MNASHKGGDRELIALARPSGDAARGVPGPLVEIQERRRGTVTRLSLYNLAEARALHAELGQALRVFALGAELSASTSAAVGQQERPVAYTGPYPIRDHGTLADQGFGESRMPELGPKSIARVAGGKAAFGEGFEKRKAGAEFCAQCDKLVAPERARQCSSTFCKLRSAAA